VHGVRVAPASSPWEWNGSVERPTFTPSILVISGHYAKTPPTPGNCWCDLEERHPGHGPGDFKCFRCHSFVADGRIQFLADCTHALANQTVDLPDVSAGFYQPGAPGYRAGD
jgi:hypothetical protein